MMWPARCLVVTASLPTRCWKCGGELYEDREARRAFLLIGIIGTRLFCWAGCTSRYVTLGLVETVERPSRPAPGAFPCGRGRAPAARSSGLGAPHEPSAIIAGAIHRG